MKKLLLSLAVIAASGAYAAYENPFASKAGPDSIDTADIQRLSTKPAEAIVPPSPGVAKTTNPPPLPETSATIPAAAAGAIAPTSPPLSAFSALQVPAQPAPQTTPLPGPASKTSSALSPAPVPLPRARPAGTPTVIQAAQTAGTPSAYQDGTIKGSSADAYYGRVQVDAVIQGGQLVSIDVLSYPSDRRTSRNINSRALPELEQEAIQAQSANIDAVSGATLTSQAFVESLDAALSAARAGGNNA